MRRRLGRSRTGARDDARAVGTLPADPVAAADALVSDGRTLDAIGLLTAANRKEPNGQVEKRLVRLRHDAFADLDCSTAPAAWPPLVDDLFAGVVGPPEVAAAELTPERLRSGILRHGCLLVRGLVPAARAARLRDAIDHAFRAYDANRSGVPTAETAPWCVPFMPSPEHGFKLPRHFARFVRDGGGVLTVDSPRAVFEVLEAFDDTGLRAVLTGYLSEPPVLSVKKWTLRRVPVGGAAGDWHQDGAFLGQGIRSVNVWLTLTRCGPDTGATGLEVLPRRMERVVETGTDGAYFDWSVGHDLVLRVADGVPLVCPEFEAGDALLFDDLLLHRTASGTHTTDERYAIESWFFGKSHYPTDQVPIAF